MITDFGLMIVEDLIEAIRFSYYGAGNAIKHIGYVFEFYKL